jgi:FlaG/FlaF family flagellin (archaellin)
VIWLAENNDISSPFDDVAPSPSASAKPESSAEPTRQTPTQDAHAGEIPIKSSDLDTKPRKYRKGDITIKDAALLFGVSPRTIQNWDDGVDAPHGYPGRGSFIELQKFAFQYQAEKVTKKDIMEKNRPIIGNDIVGSASDRNSFVQWQQKEHADDDD